MTESRFWEVWPVRRLAVLAFLAFVVGWLAWHLESLVPVLFWLALIFFNAVLLIRDWWRLPH